MSKGDRLRRSFLPAALLAAALGSAVPAHAKLDTATEGRYGGVYSNACSDAQALRVRFFGDFMTVERAGKAVNANRVRASKTHPSAGSAPDFAAVIRGEVAGGNGLSFVLHHNADGLFAVIEGDEHALAPLGPDVQGQRLRHCDPNRNRRPGAAPAAVPERAYDLMKDARFRAAWTKAIGPLSRQRWIAQLNGPAPELRSETLAGTAYTVGAVCKPHDCGDNSLVLLHDAKGGRVLALIHQNGRETLVGAPSPEMAQELRRIWRQEWRGS